APYYASPIFSFERGAGIRRFNLPRPAVFLGGCVVVRLVGKAQRQTLGPQEGDFADSFYTCVAHVALRGADVSGEDGFVFRPAAASAAAALVAGPAGAASAPAAGQFEVRAGCCADITGPATADWRAADLLGELLSLPPSQGHFAASEADAAAGFADAGAGEDVAGVAGADVAGHAVAGAAATGQSFTHSIVTWLNGSMA
ncbi:unnamed protein product, partial [Phaeothamnion confervicola]